MKDAAILEFSQQKHVKIENENGSMFLESDGLLDMGNERLVFNQFLDTQIICVCSTLIVNS